MSTTIDTALRPTDEDVAFYQERGYWVSAPILPPGLLDAAERGMQRLYSGDLDGSLPDGSTVFDHGWTPAGGDMLRKNDYASLVVDELARLVRHPMLGAVAARLAGVDEVRLWHDQLLYKPTEHAGPAGGTPRGNNVGWHTDRQYWMSCSSADMLTAWVPFHDIGTAEGGVTFVEGSHRWPENVVLDFHDQDLAALDGLRGHHDIQLVQQEIPRGAVSFHHCRLIHGSGPNLSRAPRRSLAIHVQPGGNHFADHILPDGSAAGHPNDGLVRRGPDGRPDYADPAVCPILFKA